MLKYFQKSSKDNSLNTTKDNSLNATKDNSLNTTKGNSLNTTYFSKKIIKTPQATYFSKKIIKALLLGYLVSSYSLCNAMHLVSLAKDNNKHTCCDSASEKNSPPKENDERINIMKESGYITMVYEHPNHKISNSSKSKTKSGDRIGSKNRSATVNKFTHLAKNEVATAIATTAGVYTVNNANKIGEKTTITRSDGTSCNFIDGAVIYGKNSDGTIMFEGFDATNSITLDSHGKPIAINGVATDDFILRADQSSNLINGNGHKYYASKSKRTNIGKESYGNHYFIDIKYSDNKINYISTGVLALDQFEGEFLKGSGK